MQRKTTLGLLVLMTISSGIWFGLSNAYAWKASGLTSVTETGKVLGASTGFENIVFKPYPVIRPGAPAAFANSRHYIVYHPASGRVIAGKDESLEVPVASTTKLMTATVVEAHSKPDQLLTIEKEALVGGSTMGLRAGEVISVDSLLKGMLLVSGNDAANTLAMYVGRILLNNSQATPDEARIRFVQEMNTTATKLGLTATAFKDPAGLNDDGRSSALDLAKIASGLMNDQEVLGITTTAETSVFNNTQSIEHKLKNSNKLVSEMGYPGTLIGKTGFTPEAGHCLVASAQQNGMTFVTVVLSTFSETKEASAIESKRLLDWAFANVSEITPALPAQ